MKRTILPLLVAIALVAGLDTAVAADPPSAPGAQAAAKKKAGKKKAAKCPAKPKKGKKKAGKAVADSAAKKKGKKKAAKCKAKPKKKAKATPKAGAFKLADGTYNGEDVTVTVTGGGTKARAGFPLSCFLFGGSDVPLTTGGDTATANETYTQPVGGMPATITWSLTVQSTLDYTLKTSWDIGSGGCKGEANYSGRLVKAAG